ncbi:MAG TPA: hypothetical protein PLC48_12620, partial [Ferruginibacter sp.]|nr:hypothetical protein [Ferruginibacter sp.]
VLVSNCVIGQQAKTKPFTITIGGVTITGSYSEGSLYTSTVNGTNILWGMITWGGSSTLECRGSSTAVCRIEVVTSVSIGTKDAIVTNTDGVRSLKKIAGTSGTYPMLIDAGNNAITFAVDINQVSSGVRNSFISGKWKVSTPFVLGPQVVKALGLNNGTEEKGFLIPAGEYPLYKDGNIYYWTFNYPKN